MGCFPWRSLADGRISIQSDAKREARRRIFEFRKKFRRPLPPTKDVKSQKESDDQVKKNIPLDHVNKEVDRVLEQCPEHFKNIFQCPVLSSLEHVRPGMHRLVMFSPQCTRCAGTFGMCLVFEDQALMTITWAHATYTWEGTIDDRDLNTYYHDLSLFEVCENIYLSLDGNKTMWDHDFGSNQIPRNLRVDSSDRPLRILAIDGGGVGGVIPASVLSKLERLLEKKEIFDLICGTSTGGLMALALGIGKKPAEDIVELYSTEAKTLWGQPNIFRFVSRGRWYSAEGFEQLAKRILPSGPMSQFSNFKEGQPHVFVTSCSYNCADYEGGHHFLFRNYEMKCGLYRGTDACEVWKAARCTAAAPSYFPCMEVKLEGEDENIFFDGGLVANNPVQIAIREVMRKFPGRQVSHIVTCGCGKRDTQPTAEVSPSGLLLGTLVNILTDTETAWLALQNDMLLGNVSSDVQGATLHRLNPSISFSYAVDEVEAIPALLAVGKDFADGPEVELLAKSLS